MGMFDYVKFKMKCPICKYNILEFQTKDSRCMLNQLDFWEVNNFYGECPKCGICIDFTRYGQENKEVKIEDYFLQVKKQFGNIKEIKDFFEHPKEHFEIEEDKEMAILNNMVHEKQVQKNKR